METIKTIILDHLYWLPQGSHSAEATSYIAPMYKSIAKKKRRRKSSGTKRSTVCRLQLFKFESVPGL